MLKQPLTSLLLLSAFLLPPAGALLAGAPLKVNFQGRLSENGQPAEGAKTFVFRIYDALSGGTLVWEGASQPITLSQGVFSAELSAGSPALSTAAFSGARYIEITVNGVPLAPRQELVSAPYALVAQALAPDAEIPPAAIAAGSLTDYHVALTTGAFAALNGADQLVKLDSAGKLPAADGSLLTGVPAASYSGAVAVSQLTGVINDNRVAISTQAFPGGFNGVDQLVRLDNAGKLPVLDGSALTNIGAAQIPSLDASKISSGKFYDERMAISSGAFANGFNEANELLQLDGSALVPAAKVPDLPASKITSGKFYDAQLAISTGAFPGGFNGADQLVKLDPSARLGIGTSSPVSTLEVNGSLSLPIRRVGAAGSPHAVTAGDYTILADTTDGAVTVTLPDASTAAGRTYVVKRLGAANMVSIESAGGQVEMLPSQPLSTFDGETVFLQSDGADWWVLSWYWQ